MLALRGVCITRTAFCVVPTTLSRFSASSERLSDRAPVWGTTCSGSESEARPEAVCDAQRFALIFLRLNSMGTHT